MPQLLRTMGKQKRAREVWTDPDMHALPLLTLFLDTYTADGLYWDPKTIEMEIEDDFQIQIPPKNFDKLMGAIVVLTTDDFYWSLPDFVYLCNVFSGDTHDPEVFDPADSSEIAGGLTAALLISPPEEDDPFKPEILGYIAEVLRNEGIVTPPDVLRIAQQELGHNRPDEFSDDPLLFEMIYKLEQEKTNAVNQYVKQNLAELIQQMSRLPLVNGNVEDISAKLKKSIGG